MRTAGVIIDIYDDTKGRILREKLSGRELPPEIENTALLPQEKLASMPDKLFALVAKDGTQMLRKYAMHDAGHLATSLIYFLECKHLLPEPAQKVAAVNLLRACDWYDMTPPEGLVKVAFVGNIAGKALGAAGAGAVGLDVAGQAKQGPGKMKAQMDQYKQIQMTGQLPMDGGHIKQSDLTGTEMMPAGGSLESAPKRTNTAKTRSQATTSKCGSLVPDEWVGPVDITGLEAPVKEKKAEHEHFCLPGMYPIDSYGQVKQAEAYFDENWGDFDLAERRTYALNLVDRCNQLGIKVAGRVLDYAGRLYGPHIRAELQKRASVYEGHKGGEVYEELKTKVSSWSPDSMVRALVVSDQALGADNAYNRPIVGFRDPFAAVYGVKVAKEQLTGDNDASRLADSEETSEYAWNMGSDYVTGDQLREMANRSENVDGVLGEGFSKEFFKDPVGVFEALPDPQKHVLARLASDNSGGTFRQ